MTQKSSKSIHNYETLVQIKLSAQVLEEGFWMGDLVDFLKGYHVKIVGNSTNTSKWQLAKSSLEGVKRKTKLNKIFKAVLENKHWYYPEPTETLKKLAQTTKFKMKGNLKEKEIFLSILTLHPTIRKVSKKLYLDGYYSQTIFEAYKAVVNQVKDISGVKNFDGKPLMEYVFSVNSPIIKFNNLQTQSEKDEQVGLMLLFSGATLGIRNPKAHDNAVQKDQIRTLEYLSFASLLLKRLDERVK